MILVLWLLWGAATGKISDVNPESYSILFNIHPETAQFTGSSDVKFQLLNFTKHITINCKDLEIIRLMLYQVGHI